MTHDLTTLNRLLTSAYHLQLASLQPLTGTGDKQLYRAEDVHGQRLILRVYSLAQRETVDALLHVLFFLEQQAYAAERVVAGIQNASVITDNGAILVVTTFIEGKAADFSPTTLHNVGAQLGRLHALPLEARFALPIAQMLPAPELAYAQSQLASVAQDVPRELRPRYDVLLDAIQHIASCTHLPTVLLHNDCHLANTLHTPAGQMLFIDWEGAGVGPAVIDVGFLLVSSNKASLWTPELAPDLQRIPALVEGYCQYHLLTPEELDYLPDAIRFRSLVYGSCHLAEAIRQRRYEDDEQWWWLRYQAADEIASRARECFERYL